MNNAGYDVQNANKVVKKGIDNIKTFGVVCEDEPRIKKADTSVSVAFS